MVRSLYSGAPTRTAPAFAHAAESQGLKVLRQHATRWPAAGAGLAVTPICGSYPNVRQLPQCVAGPRAPPPHSAHAQKTHSCATNTHTSCARAHTNEVNVQAGGPSGRPAGCTPCQPRVPWRRNSESSGGTGGRMQRP